MQETSERAGYIYQKISHKKEVRIAEVFWRFSSYKLISCGFVFSREVFCISYFCLGFFLVKKFFLAFSRGLQHREVIVNFLLSILTL